MPKRYLMRGGGGRFTLTACRPQKTGLTVVTFPPLPAREGRFHVDRGRLVPVPETKRTPVEVREVPDALADELAQLQDRHKALLDEAHRTYHQYLRRCMDTWGTLLPARFPPPEDPS